jgi:hypothetical protein
MVMLRALLGGVILGTVALQGWTQYVAQSYGYHALLGTPWWSVEAFYRRHPLYPPWKGVLWTWQWGGTSWRLGLVGGAVLLLGLVVLGSWVGRRQRRTQPPPMTGHGTTQWATRRDVKKAGLV